MLALTRVFERLPTHSPSFQNGPLSWGSVLCCNPFQKALFSSPCSLLPPFILQPKCSQLKTTCIVVIRDYQPGTLVAVP